MQGTAIDAARELFLFFLRHREITHLVSSDRGTHFTGEIYRQFCNQMFITPELHCLWRPQSSGNIERQHRKMKNALYMLCEDRNCEWTDVFESVSSSINATINSVLRVHPHYTITGRHPQYQSLPKQPRKEIVKDDLGAYDMQINTLQRQVHHCVTLGNNEADHKMKTCLNRLTYKDPIQVGDKVLLHRPRSNMAQSSHLFGIDFAVMKINDMMSQVENENGVTARIEPRPTYLSDIIPSLPPCDTHQNTPDPLSLPTSGAYNSKQTSKLQQIRN